MKKSLIALAVAGAFAAPAFADTANVDFYGQFRVSVDHINNFDNGGAGKAPGGWGMNDEASRIGFKGAEDLGGGLKAIYQWESGFNPGAEGWLTGGNGPLTGTGSGGTVGSGSPTAQSAGGLGTQRDTFVGLSGGFGTIIAGRHDTPYKMAGSADLFADTLADAQNMGPRCIICEDVRANNAIAYVSPNMSGLSVVGAIIPGNFQQSGPSNKALNGLADAYSLAAMYANGPLSLSAGYENLNNYVANASTGSFDSKHNAWKLNGSYTIGDLKLGATWETIDHVFGQNSGDGSKMNDYLLSAAYGMGPITLAAQYGVRNPTGGGNNLTDATVGVIYSLSKRTSTYVGYAHYGVGSGMSYTGNVKDDGQALNAWTFGMNHSF